MTLPLTRVAAIYRCALCESLCRRQANVSIFYVTRSPAVARIADILVVIQG